MSDDQQPVVTVKPASATHEMFVIGITVILIFGMIVAITLFCAFKVLTGEIVIKDPGTIAMVSGLIGTLVGYVASNAQQVVGFWFGSSAGSAKKDSVIAEAMKG